IGDVEAPHMCHAALPCDETLPRMLDATAERRDHAETRDDHSSHVRLLSSSSRSGVSPSDVSRLDASRVDVSRSDISRLDWPPSRRQHSRTRANNRMKPEGSALRVLLKEFDRIAHGQNGLSCVVGYFATELLLESHDELDGVETVGAEIVDEARSLGHLVGFNAQVLDDDLFHPLANITHRFALISFHLARPINAPEPLS